MIALIDSDPVCYRIAFACKDEKLDHARRAMDSYLVSVLLDLDYEDKFFDQWKLFLSDSTENNFRTKIAVTAPYKGNRTQPKPEHLAGLRKHLIRQWGAVIVPGIEADDAVAIEATADPTALIVSVDKDLDQLPGLHYNNVSKKHYEIDALTGLRNFYKQILTGDSIDNIIGIRGVGPVSASQTIDHLTTEKEMFDACVEAYNGQIERVIENGKLLWLLRKPGEVWNGIRD